MSVGGEKGYVYSRILRLSGDQKTSGNSNTDFTITYGQSLQNIKRVSFVSCSFPNNVNNIRAGVNNNVTYILNDISGTSNLYTHAIPPGQYDITQLMTIINGFLVADSALNASISWDYSASKKVIITNPYGLNTYFELQNTGGSVWHALGFVVPFTSDQFTGIGVIVPTGTSLTATNLPALGGLSSVYLQSYALSPGNSIDESGTIRNVSVSIPVTAAYGSLNVFECRVDTLCQVTYPTPRNIQQIDFQLVDNHNNIIDLQGGNLKVCLRIWFDRI